MRFKISILMILFFIATSIYAVKPKKTVYPDPPTDFLQETSVIFGSLTSGFVEAIDLTDNVVYDHISAESSLDADVVLRVGKVGGQEIILKAYTSFVMSNIDFPGKIYIKYRSAPPTKGEAVLRFW